VREPEQGEQYGVLTDLDLWGLDGGFIEVEISLNAPGIAAWKHWVDMKYVSLIKEETKQA
jgi:hypothetical protein